MSIQSNLNQLFKIHAVFLVFAPLCVCFQILNVAEIMEYDRVLINDGQLWRILSCNFIHLTWAHLGLNMLTLGIASFLFPGRVEFQVMVLVILISSIGTSLGIYFLNPEERYMLGFSGTVWGIVAAGCWRQRNYDKLPFLFGTGFIVIKLVSEQIYGPPPGAAAHAGGTIAVDAHLYGAVSGFLGVILFDFLKALKKSA